MNIFLKILLSLVVTFLIVAIVFWWMTSLLNVDLSESGGNITAIAIVFILIFAIIFIGIPVGFIGLLGGGVYFLKVLKAKNTGGQGVGSPPTMATFKRRKVLALALFLASFIVFVAGVNLYLINIKGFSGGFGDLVNLYSPTHFKSNVACETACTDKGWKMGGCAMSEGVVLGKTQFGDPGTKKMVEEGRLVLLNECVPPHPRSDALICACWNPISPEEDEWLLYWVSAYKDAAGEK